MSSSTYPKLELKYCERCGSLWLRPRGGEAVYCARCEEAIAELPPVPTRGGSGSGPAPGSPARPGFARHGVVVGATHAAFGAVLAFLTALCDFAGQIGGAVA